MYKWNAAELIVTHRCNMKEFEGGKLDTCQRFKTKKGKGTEKSFCEFVTKGHFMSIKDSYYNHNI